MVVFDLSPAGCSITGIAAGISKNQPLLIWLGEFGPIPSTLKWAKKGVLGMAFNTPIEPDAITPLTQLQPSPAPDRSRVVR